MKNAVTRVLLVVLVGLTACSPKLPEIAPNMTPVIPGSIPPPPAVSTPKPVSRVPSTKPAPSVPEKPGDELTIIQRDVLAMMLDFDVTAFPENEMAGSGNATNDMSIFPSSRFHLYGMTIGNTSVLYFPSRYAKGTYSVDTRGTVTQVSAGTANNQPAVPPTPSPAPAPYPPPITDPALARPRSNFPESTPPPAGIGGWKQPRPLTDEEKQKVIEIALNSPQVKAWLNGRTDYGMGSVCWFAIIWENGTVKEYSYPQYEVVNTGVPDWVNPHAWWYPAISLWLGEWGSRTQMQMAINLDHGKVTFVDGPYPPPGQFRVTLPR